MATSDPNAPTAEENPRGPVRWGFRNYLAGAWESMRGTPPSAIQPTAPQAVTAPPRFALEAPANPGVNTRRGGSIPMDESLFDYRDEPGAPSDPRAPVDGSRAVTIPANLGIHQTPVRTSTPVREGPMDWRELQQELRQADPEIHQLVTQELARQVREHLAATSNAPADPQRGRGIPPQSARDGQGTAVVRQPQAGGETPAPVTVAASGTTTTRPKDTRSRATDLQLTARANVKQSEERQEQVNFRAEIARLPVTAALRYIKRLLLCDAITGAEACDLYSDIDARMVGMMTMLGEPGQPPVPPTGNTDGKSSPQDGNVSTPSLWRPLGSRKGKTCQWGPNPL